MTNRRKTIGGYDLLSQLSSGSHSELHAAVRSEEGAQRGDIRCLRVLLDPSHGAKLFPSLKRELEFADTKVADVENVHAVFLHEDRLAIVTDLIEGESLHNILRAERGPLSAKLLVPLALAIVRAVKKWQQRPGIRGAHGDLCPSNVMLTYDGRVIVREFAVSLFQSGLRAPSSPIGDIAYMAPERIRTPLTADASADVYSLGLILFRMVTGQAAISGENPKQLLAAATKPRLAKPSSLVKCWGSLERLILAAASPEVADRPILEDVEQALTDTMSARSLQGNIAPEVQRLLGAHFQHRARALKTMKARWRGESESGSAAEPKSRRPSTRGQRSGSVRSEPGFELIGAPKQPQIAVTVPSRPARARSESAVAAFSQDFASGDLSPRDLPFRDLVTGDLPSPSGDLVSRDLPSGDLASRDLPTSDVPNHTGELPRVPRRRLSFAVGVTLCLTLSLGLSAAALYLPPEWRRFLFEMAQGMGETLGSAFERLIGALDP